MRQQVDAEAAVGLEEADPGSSRRGFLGTLTKAALGVVAGAAHLWSSAERAWADGWHYQCCHLAYPASGGSCPSQCSQTPGYQGRGWYCPQGGSTWYCYECTSGDTCWQEDWLCSDIFLRA